MSENYITAILEQNHRTLNMTVQWSCSLTVTVMTDTGCTLQRTNKKLCANNW